MTSSPDGARLIYTILLTCSLAFSDVHGSISRVRRQTDISAQNAEKHQPYIQSDTWTRALVDSKAAPNFQAAPSLQPFNNDVPRQPVSPSYNPIQNAMPTPKAPFNPVEPSSQSDTWTRALVDPNSKAAESPQLFNNNQPLTKPEDLDKFSKFANGILERIGLATGESGIRRKPLPSTSYQNDEFDDLVNEANQNRIDLQGLTSGQIPGLAPIPVPGFPGPQDIPSVPGVNTIPGLSNFNYVVGQLVPQMIPPTNTLLGASISRLLPKEATKNLAKNVFRAVHPAAENVDVSRMMGRWFQVINSPHVIREACTVSHFGALTNNTYSATFTILKFYREGNPNGPPRYSLSYGFKSGDTGQFLLHNSNSPDAEPFWVIKLGPLNEYNQYDYAVVSNWVRFPVFVIARDPERFTKVHMKSVLQFLEDNNYINVVTKAFNMISPVDYSQCQYTPTFSGAGK